MSITKLLDYDKDKTLILLDIDNTILYSENKSYGSVEWCSHMIKKYGFIIGISAWQHALLNRVKMVPVEGDTTFSTLKQIKKADIIFCTKRSVFLKNKTMEQLNLRDDPPSRLQNGLSSDCHRYSICNDKILKYGLFYFGILFCDLEDKEDCINEIIKKTTFGYYDNYVIVDDNPINTDKFKGSPVIFFHYKKAYERKVKSLENTEIKRVIIFISGKMGSGKDLVASYIKEIYKETSVVRIAIADKLKEIIARVTNVSLDDCYNNKSMIPKDVHKVDHTGVILEFLKKETNLLDSDDESKRSAYLKVNKIIQKILESRGSTIGQYLQIIGEEFREKFGKPFFLDMLWDKISKEGMYLITDGRLKFEANFFKSKEAVMIRIERDYELRKPHFKKRDPDHVTEIDLDDYLFQFTIYNNWTGKEGKKKLYNRLEYLFKIKD